MTIQEAQTKVDEWIKTTGVKYFSELTNLGILTEEVGELARIIVRKYGEQSFKESDTNKELGDEMADILWVLMCLANQTGVDLTNALEKNFEKKDKRDANRHKDNEKLK
jgi:NTP pyrophosphatase (non-canonical NTP hydrolase)